MKFSLSPNPLKGSEIFSSPNLLLFQYEFFSNLTDTHPKSSHSIALSISSKAPHKVKLKGKAAKIANTDTVLEDLLDSTSTTVPSKAHPRPWEITVNTTAQTVVKVPLEENLPLEDLEGSTEPALIELPPLDEDFIFIKQLFFTREDAKEYKVTCFTYMNNESRTWDLNQHHFLLPPGIRHSKVLEVDGDGMDVNNEYGVQDFISEIEKVDPDINEDDQCEFLVFIK